MKRVHQGAAVRLSGRYNDFDRRRQARHGAPGHAFQIDAHAESGRKVAEFSEVSDQTPMIGIVTADAQAFRPKFACGLQHARQISWHEIGTDDDELDVMRAYTLGIHPGSHLTHLWAANRDLVEGGARKRR